LPESYVATWALVPTTLQSTARTPLAELIFGSSYREVYLDLDKD